MTFDLLDERNGVAFDCSGGEVVRNLVVASTPRCGSTMLCRTLWETGLVGAPKEYLNPTQIRDWRLRTSRGLLERSAYATIRGRGAGALALLPWSDRQLMRYTRALQDHRTGTNGWFGLKMHWHHFDRVFARPGRNPEAFFGPIVWVHMTRGDRLGQAISWARALQTQRWSYQQSDRGRPRYRRGLIARTMRWVDDGERKWNAWFRKRGVQTVSVRYESYVAEHTKETRRVLRALGIEVDMLHVPSAPTVVQRDTINEEWKERFLRGE